MKKRLAILLLLSLFVVGSLSAQSHKKDGSHHFNIEQVIETLTPQQKAKLERLQSKSEAELRALKKSMNEVRDSIYTYMSMSSDQSATLFPLFEREAALKVEMNKALYQLKQRIDAVLTQEQRDQLKERMRELKESKSR